MRRFNPRISLLVIVGLLFSPLAGGATETTSTAANQAGAGELIADAQKAVGQVVRAARDDEKLDPESADAKPFWQAMKYLNESLDKTDTGLTLKDDTFFPNLATAVAAVQQAEIALSMTGVDNATVTSTMQTLGAIVQTLDENYSKEAARLKQGGDLTPAEKKQLDELKAKTGELEKNLEAVKKKAAKNDEKMQEGIKKIEEQAKKIKNAGNTAAGFAAGMVASRMMSGLVWGWHWWWGPWGYWGPGWININIIIWDDWAELYAYDWTYLDALIDVGDLGLDAIDYELADLAETEAWLDQGDFGLEDADMVALTDDLDAGWDDVETDIGMDVMMGMESNFDAMPFDPDPGFEFDTFDDFGGFDDFGDDFGGFDDW